MIAQHQVRSSAGGRRVSQLPAPPSRQQLRLRSIAWALTAGIAALLLGLPMGLEAALRAGGCGFFYGLLAFHLQRVDPDDSHLQAGLVGAVCGIHSLGLPAASPWPQGQPWPAALLAVAPTVMMGLIRAWLPLVGAALLLHLSLQLLRHGSRLVAARDLSARRP
jgi:hypothetical protein